MNEVLDDFSGLLCIHNASSTEAYDLVNHVKGHSVWYSLM
jgi:hypothetical protein